MTANLALRKAPPLEPGEFRFITKAVSIEPHSEGEPRRFKMIASSTVVDEGKDEIKLSALKDLEQSFSRGLNIFTDHDHKVDNVFGRTDTAFIKDSGERDSKTNAPIYDLHIAGVVNEPNPRMIQLADSIDGGYVTFGASIGARVREHQRNKAGGMDIHHIDGKEASLVGIPMNQRSWTYKAAKAAVALDEQALDEDEEDEPVAVVGEDAPETLADAPGAAKALALVDGATEDETVVKGDLGATDELLTRALDTESGAALQRQDLCTKCAHEADCSCTTCDCSATIHKAISADDLTIKAADEETVNADVQESETETPETTPADPDEEAATPDAEKAFSFEPTDVVTLALKARDLAQAVSDRDDEIATLKAERDRLTSENEEAKQVIEKMLAMPLRAKTAIVGDISRRLPDFLAPEVRNFLNKTAGE